MFEVPLTVKVLDDPNFVLGHSVSPYSVTWCVQVGQALVCYATKEALQFSLIKGIRRRDIAQLVNIFAQGQINIAAYHGSGPLSPLRVSIISFIKLARALVQL